MSKVFETSYEVCSCSNVSLGEIIYAIEKKGVKNLKELQESTDIGVHCKFCICKDSDFGKIKKRLYCTDILKKFVENKDARV